MKEVKKYMKITFEEAIVLLSDVLNLVDKRLYDHHKQVAYIACEIAKGYNLPIQKLKQVVMIGLIHDIGMFKENEIIHVIQFHEADVEEHTIKGYLLLKSISSLSYMAEIIKYHHKHWNNGKQFKNVKKEIALFSQIIYIADRVSVLIQKNPQNALSLSNKILNILEEEKGSRFNPKLVDVFKSVSNYPAFWLNIVTEYKEPIIKKVLNMNSSYMTYDNFINFSKLFIYCIDFRSRYTATHSIGVATVAERLAKLCKMSETECKDIKIAGYLHDIGKLSIPVEILEKPGKLTQYEYSIIKQHTYYTYHILNKIKGMEKIRDIAAFHHETLDGKGYPFKIEGSKLSKASRLMCVADIFTALTEKRSYRNSMKKDQVINILYKMVEKNKIDKEITKLAIDNYEELYRYNKKIQNETIKEFYYFQNAIQKLQ